MRRACASASSPPPSSAASTCGAASCGSWARGARSGSGCWGGPLARRSRAYLGDGRPALVARRAPLSDEPTAVFLNHHGAPLGVRGLRGRMDRLRRARGPPRGRQPPHAAPQLRDPPARGRRGPARRAGAARAREPRDDAGLHARVAGPPARGVPDGASAGPGDVRDDPTARSSACRAGRATRRRAPGARGRGRRRLGADARPRAGRLHRHAPVPRVADPGLPALCRDRERRPGPEQLDSFFAAFRIPDFLFQLVAAGALSSALIPVIAGLLATEQEARAWRVVSTVTTLMLGALLGPGRRRAAVRPAARRVDHAGLRRLRAGADDRAHADHGPLAAVPRGRARSRPAPSTRAAGSARPRSRRSPTTSRSSAGRCSSSRCSGSTASPSASSSARPATCSSSCRRCAGSAPGSAAARPQRPAGAAGAACSWRRGRSASARPRSCSSS